MYCKIIQKPGFYIFLFLLLILILIVCSIICSLLIVFLFIIGYMIYKINHFSKTGNYIEEYDYRKKSKMVLMKYGDYEIKELYLLKKPFKAHICKLLNLCTMYKYHDLIMKTTDVYHSEILLIVQKKKKQKYITLHKRPNIILTGEIKIAEETSIQKIPIHSNIKLSKLLSSVKNKMGSSFFNWNIIDNNCHNFAKNIIDCLKKKDRKYFDTDIISHITMNKYSKFDIDIYILNVFTAYVIIGNNFNLDWFINKIVYLLF